MSQLFLLADINNCYASIFKNFMPELKNRPIVVLSNNDGSIIARSQEAKDLGIKMGQPYFEVRPIIEKNGVQVFSSNYALFHDMSVRFHATVGQFAPVQEIYSIDESFLEVGNLYNVDLKEYGHRIKSTVWKWLGLPICIGIAPTKTLAKLANRLAKKSKKAGGVVVLNNPDHITAALIGTDVGDVWGIGSQYAAKLRSFGINNAWQLSQVSDSFAKKHLTIVGLRLVKELRGTPCADLEVDPAAKKGICTSRSFGQPVTFLPDLIEAVTAYTTRCAEKLRKQNSACKHLTVFLHTNSFRTSDKQYSNSKTIELPVASNSTLELTEYAVMALKSIFLPGYKFKKAGVIITDICPASSVQLSLVDTLDRGKHADLMSAWDKLTKKMGRDVIQLASKGINNNNWKMRQDYDTPCFTTRLEEVLRVR